MSPAVLILTLAALAEPPAAAPVREVKPADAPIAPSAQSAVVPVRKSSGPVRRVDTNAEAGPLRGDLEVVDSGREDVGALATSFRQPSHDARLPTGFQRVYRVPGEEDKLMRGNGALFAVFPESVYRRTPRGMVALAPPGTVFHIGMPGELHLSPEAPPARVLAVGQIDGRVTTRIGPDAPAGAARIDTRLGGGQTTAPAAASGASVGDRVRVDSPEPASPLEATPIAPASAQTPKGMYDHLGFGPARVQRD